MEYKKVLNENFKYLIITLYVVIFNGVKRPLYPEPLPPEVSACVDDSAGAQFFNYENETCQTALKVKVESVQKLKEILDGYGIKYNAETKDFFDIVEVN